MKVYTTSFTLSTDDRTEISDITKLVRDAVQQLTVTTGIALVNTLHTTCALSPSGSDFEPQQSVSSRQISPVG